MGRLKAETQTPPSSHKLRRQSLIWDLAPLIVLAGAGVALLSPPGDKGAIWFQRGRGRRARSPAEIPRRGWRDILLRAKAKFAKDQAPMMAAGVTFYTLLALFPGLAAFVSLYGLFADVGEVEHHLRLLSFVLPPAAMSLLSGEMVHIATAGKGGQTLAFVLSLAASIWSANGAVKALITGLNIAYDEVERRSVVKKTLLSLAFTLGLLAFATVAVALLAAQPAITAFAGAPAATLFGWIAWPTLLAALTIGLALLYRFGPSRDPVQWTWISWGSAAVVLFWLVASTLFSAYLGDFAHYDKAYGSLGAAIGFMMWIYLSAVVVLAGAELNAEIEHQTTVDTTIGPPMPMGLRRATMADTVGRAQN
jgi:membrane protein